MKPKLATPSAALCGLLLAALSGAARAKGPRPVIAWQPSFQAALQEARRLKKPLLVDFGARWCGPCHAMDQRTFTDAAVVRQSRQWVAVKVDIEAQPEIASRYGLKSPPMLAFLKPDGTLASRFEGYADAPVLLKQMKAAYLKARRNSVLKPRTTENQP